MSETVELDDARDKHQEHLARLSRWESRRDEDNKNSGRESGASRGEDEAGLAVEGEPGLAEVGEGITWTGMQAW